ncbi:MAG: SH3 domain-containing protein [Candidatus Wallbacteria bacterium]|nr:SH3 domain-containing protein [Candidatus Wallbacteria bacterium]
MHSKILLFALFLTTILQARLEFRYSYTDQNLPFLGMVNASNVNIRETPTLKGNILKKASINEDYFVTKMTQGFYQVKLPPLRGFVATQYISEEPQEEDLFVKLGTITGNNVNMRKEASLQAGVINKLNKGQELIIYEQDKDFSEVELLEDRSAYIFKEYISPRKEERYLVTGDNVNLRSGPGLNYPVVGKLQRGESVLLLKQSNNFARVLIENGKSGWVSTDYIKKTESEADSSGSDDLRSQILKNYSEDNYLEVINLGEKKISSSPILDLEICSAVINSCFNLHDYAKAVYYLKLVKAQSPDFFLENLSSIEDRIADLLGKYTIVDLPRAKNFASGDIQTDGTEDYLVLQGDESGNSLSVYRFEGRFSPTLKPIALDQNFDLSYFKIQDINNDGKPELLLSSEGTLSAYDLDPDRAKLDLLKKLPDVVDLCFEGKHSHNIFGIVKKNGLSLFRLKPSQDFSPKDFRQLPAKFDSPLIFPASLNLDLPQFLVVNRTAGIFLLTWGNSLQTVPLNLPEPLEKRLICFSTTLDFDQDDSTDLLLIFGGTGAEPPTLKIFSIRDSLVERFSMDISATAARGMDLDFNGKTDLVILTPDDQAYILYDIKQRK